MTTRADHQTVNSALARLAALDLADLGRRIHAALELDLRHPSTPDGYPTQTPGHSTTPTGPPPVLEGTCHEPGCHAERPCPDHDIPAGWTPVERDAVRRLTHHDEISSLTRKARDQIAQAADALDLANALLTDLAKRRTRPPALGDACELLASVGGYAPAHRNIPDPTDPDPTINDPTLVDDRRRYRVSRWVYDFARRHNRFPTIDELRHHMAGRHVHQGANP